MDWGEELRGEDVRLQLLAVPVVVRRGRLAVQGAHRGQLVHVLALLRLRPRRVAERPVADPMGDREGAALRRQPGPVGDPQGPIEVPDAPLRQALIGRDGELEACRRHVVQADVDPGPGVERLSPGARLEIGDDPRCLSPDDGPAVHLSPVPAPAAAGALPAGLATLLGQDVAPESALPLVEVRHARTPLQ
jgi:hypothetical protein